MLQSDHSIPRPRSHLAALSQSLAPAALPGVVAALRMLRAACRAQRVETSASKSLPTHWPGRSKRKVGGKKWKNDRQESDDFPPRRSRPPRRREASESLSQQTGGSRSERDDFLDAQAKIPVHCHLPSAHPLLLINRS